MFEKIPEKKSFAKKETEPTNIVEMETANARYRIYYDNHESVVSSRLLDNCDGLVMEIVDDYGDSQKAKKTFGNLNRLNQFSEILQAVAKKKQPVYFVDMWENINDLSAEINMLGLKTLAEFLASAGFLTYALKEIKENKKMSRRNFLKLGAKTVAAAYFATPILQDAAFLASLDKQTNVPDERSNLRKTEKTLGEINKVIHPELATVAMDARNDLMAQKTETLARLFYRETGKKPRLALIVGAKHSGIEGSLKDSESERIDRLRKSLGVKLSQNASIAKIEFVSGEKDTTYYDAKIIKDAALETQ